MSFPRNEPCPCESGVKAKYCDCDTEVTKALLRLREDVQKFGPWRAGMYIEKLRQDRYFSSSKTKPLRLPDGDTVDVPTTEAYEEADEQATSLVQDLIGWVEEGKMPEPRDGVEALRGMQNGSM